MLISNENSSFRLIDIIIIFPAFFLIVLDQVAKNRQDFLIRDSRNFKQIDIIIMGYNFVRISIIIIIISIKASIDIMVIAFDSFKIIVNWHLTIDFAIVNCQIIIITNFS